MKACIYCAELIQDAAAKCRFCGEWLDVSKRPAWSQDNEIGAPAPAPPTATPPGPHGPVTAPGHASHLAAVIPSEHANPARAERPAAAPALPSEASRGATARRPTERGYIPKDDWADLASATVPDGPAYSSAPRHPTRPDAPSEAGWSAPPWLAQRAQAEASEARQARAYARHEPEPELYPDPVSDPPMEAPHAIDSRASLEEVALRMQRIKASAAAVRRAVQAEAERRNGSPAAGAAMAPRPVEPVDPSMASVRPPVGGPPARQATASGAFMAAAARPETARGFDDGHGRPRKEAFAGDGFAGDAFADDDFGDDDFGDDDFGDDPYEDDSGVSGFGDLAAAPRPFPWRPVLISASLMFAFGVVVLGSSLFGDDEEPTDVAAEEQPPADPPAAVAAADASPPTAVTEVEPVPPPGTGQPVEAESPAPGVVDPATKQQLDEASKLYMSAEGGSRGKKLNASKALLETVLAAHPKQPDALRMLAQIQLEQGQAEESLATATTCTQVAPEQADCWLTIGTLEHDKRNKEAASVAWERYLSLAPDGKYAGDVRKILKK